jgi:exopolysaccharide biosynthesis polyprenyl glycosylphosphotransferase
VLHHRLNAESHSYGDVSTGFSHSVDPIPKVGTRLVSAAMAVADVSTYSILASAARDGSFLSQSVPGFAPLRLLILCVALWLAAACATRLYAREPLRAGDSRILPAALTALLAFAPWLIVASLPASNGPAFGRVIALLAMQLALVAAVRMSWLAALRILLRRGYCLERVIIVAVTASAERVLSAALERQSRGRMRVAASATAPKLRGENSLIWLEATVRSHGIDRIILADGTGASPLDRESILSLARVGPRLTIISDVGADVSLSADSAFLPRMDDQAPPLSPGQLACKRAFDVAVSAVALVCLLPVLLAVTALVKLGSPGPVLFRQTRQGLHGQPFEILKFRTMYADMGDPSCTLQTIRNDTRVTRIGRFLRSTSLDELPQLLNVLLGTMSIIGPRPHALGMLVAGQPVAGVLIGYNTRLRVKPGITGWAQINGSRGEVASVVALRKRVALDCHYIENWSLMLDVSILCRTVSLILHDKYAF